MEKIDWNEWFYYDENSPSCLRWKVDIYSGGGNGKILGRKLAEAGGIAGSLRNNTGYYSVRLHNKSYSCHRVIWELLYEVEIPCSQHIDHIDGVKENNKVWNLRLVTSITNSRNRKLSSNNNSGCNGVAIKWNGSSWCCVARWKPLDSKEKSKAFSINKLGIMVAFRDAVIHRQKMIEELNSQGAGYTERHGKEQV